MTQQQELNLSEQKGTVKDKVLKILKESDYITLADLRRHFMDTEAGSQSCDRYLRFLKFDGFNIVKRKKEGSKNTWEYRLEQ